MWPVNAEHLIAVQQDVAAAAAAESWTKHANELRVGGCWVCFHRGLTGRGHSDDPAWAAAVTMVGPKVIDHHVTTGVAGASYLPGLLALRLGPLMEQTMRSLDKRPDVLLLDASGRDHPRRAGLAVHLGAVLDMPTVGVTHRPLVAKGPGPGNHRGATSPLRIGEEVVACWMCTRPGTRPVVVHPGWGIDLPTAVDLVAGSTPRHRTPEPLRRARQLARNARADAPAGPVPR